MSDRNTEVCDSLSPTAETRTITLICNRAESQISKAQMDLISLRLLVTITYTYKNKTKIHFHVNFSGSKRVIYEVKS